MKKATLLVLAIAAMCTAAAVIAKDEAATTQWIDFKNCAMCQPFSSVEGMMDHCTWESYKIATGTMCVLAVPTEFAGKFTEAEKQMKAVSARMQAGEKMHLCGMCQSMVGLMQEGAKMDEIDSKVGHLSTLTSSDPKLVAKIHAHHDKTMEEWGKMMAAQKSAEAGTGQGTK